MGKTELNSLSRFAHFNIVLIYAVFGLIYIYTSDYFLEWMVKDPKVLTQLQTFKGFGFIFATSSLLFVLVKRNMEVTSAYYLKAIDLKNKSDDALNKLNADYMTLFDHSPLPMWVFDKDSLQIIRVNEATCENYGFTHEEYSKMTLRDIRPPEDIQKFENLYSLSVNTTSHSFSDIFRHKKKNGELIYVKIKNAAITFNGQQVRLASEIDVTAEMQTQENLSATNARLQRACEIAGIGYWTNDFTDNTHRWSTELYKMFECDRNSFDLNIESISSMFHPEDRKQFIPDAVFKLEENKVNESEHRIYTTSGKLKWILERLYLTKDENGTPLRIEGIALDITKRKLNEQEIWESHERFKILSDASFEAIIDWDLKTDTVMWGEGFHTLFGYDLNNCSKNLWVRGIHPEDRRSVLDELGRTLKDPSKTYFNSEFRFLKANGEIANVQHRGVFIRDLNGRVIRAVAAMTDLTEALERIRKIELQNLTLREIAWTQSHLVRSPLANIKGITRLLLENFENGKRDHELIAHLMESAEQLDLIIHKIVKKSETFEHA
jgi:PAS domain S-box-containing protein